MLTDEQLAEADEEIENGPLIRALTQEVRRLREGLERSRRIRASMEKSAAITGERLEKAEAERVRYRRAIEQALANPQDVSEVLFAALDQQEGS